VFWLLLAVVAVVVFAVTAVALGVGGSLPEAYPDRPDLALPADRLMTSHDLEALRFTVAFRGYRMDEVDVVLNRLRNEIARRDMRIAQLEVYPGIAPQAPPSRPQQAP
jgi:DivIVA domain-containing protein